MADDGMLLNFEVGNAPVASTQSKFKGGKWRERVRANKSLRRGAPTAVGDDLERPTKRQRTDDTSKPPHSSPQTHVGLMQRRPPGAQAGRPPPPGGVSHKPHVSSRLFSSNPEATTDFAPVQAEADEVDETTTPSNAPLSEEAANFHALGLSRRVAQHLSIKLEMKAPTAIQKSTIPQLVQQDADAFLQAETGSGKTLAYLLPIVQRILALSQNEKGVSKGPKINRGSGLFAIILAPTRELCKQIATVLEKLLGCAPWIVSTTVIGGESKKSEKARLRKGANILIATPGRLADHLDHTKVLDVRTVRWLVLDEGDRLMEMGFEQELRQIVSRIRMQDLAQANKDGVKLDTLPTRRVTVLCSATMKMNVQKLGEISLEDAIHIIAAKPEAGDDKIATEANEAAFSAPSQLKQSFVVVPAKLRLVTLIALLKNAFSRKGSVMKAIIFISCADSVDFHFDLLKSGTPEETSTTDDAKDSKDKKPSPTAVTTALSSYITSPANPAVQVIKLHGSLAQPVRTATLQAFSKSKEPAILITTDIASRGLDVPAVDLVIEYDPAFAVDDHVHRIGRTARAGRPGKAVLFLQPGCEEGYAALLKSATSALTPQLYDTVLQQGLATQISYPIETDATSGDNSGDSGRKTWTSRAEELQLHLEQRLVLEDNVKLLDAARQAFRSHVRAYATHVRDERKFFDITQFHLGHMAKAFGLREAPGGIGGGVSRRSGVHHKVSSAGAASRKSAGKKGDEERPTAAGVTDDAAQRMRAKMRAVMNSGAGEFNIG